MCKITEDLPVLKDFADLYGFVLCLYAAQSALWIEKGLLKESETEDVMEAANAIYKRGSKELRDKIVTGGGNGQ